MNAQLDAQREPRLALILDALRSGLGQLPAWKRRDPLSQLVRSMLSLRLEDPLAEAAFAKLRQSFKPLGRLCEAREEEVARCVASLPRPEQLAAGMIQSLDAIRRRTGMMRLDGLADLAPADAMEWLQDLPGVDAVTAAATLNLSTLQLRVPLIDPVSLRVAERLRLVSPGMGAKACGDAIADEAPAGWDGAEFTELHVLMGRLGETFCVASGPDCGGCPLRRVCPSALSERDALGVPGHANENHSPGDALDGYLRRRIARLEQQGVSVATLTDAGVSLGVSELDGAFIGGKLPPGIHHCVGSRVEDGSAAMILAVATFLALPGTVDRAKLLIVQEIDARREHGDLHGPGLLALGLSPENVVFIRAKDGAEALMVADEALRSRAAPVVLLELRRGGRGVDLAVTRRFNMAARRAGVFMFLITPDLDATSAATTRWMVSSTTSQGQRRRLGPPTFNVDLVRNRAGSSGRWIIEWSAAKRRFSSARRIEPEARTVAVSERRVG